MELRTDSSWFAVRCNSLTEAAPSKAPSSISDTLLLLRFLGKEEVRSEEWTAGVGRKLSHLSLQPTGSSSLWLRQTQKDELRLFQLC